MSIFVKIKSWQLFAYLFFMPAIMILFNIFMNGNLAFYINLIIQSALINLYIFIYGVWMFGLGKSLKVHEAARKTSRILGYNLFILIAYTIIINYLIIDHLLLNTGLESFTDSSYLSGLLPYMLSFQIYSTLLYLVTLYIFTKALMLREGNGSSLKHEIVTLIWFIVSPIGVWILQPRIRKIFAK